MPETPPIEKFYLTTPIYYVNARPHIGHAYTTLVADTLARRHRLLGHDTYLLTGTDEHGQKIERSAAAAGIPPQQFADEVSASFRSLWDRMGITYSDFIRTTEPRHKVGVQKLFEELQKQDAIYLSTYTGQYCVSDEAYVDGPPGIRCPDCGRVTETVSEENYYFKLSEYGDRIIALIESGKLAIQPDSRRNEVLSFLRSGLKDLSISRTSFNWGIPVPGNPKHVIYVWLDALANYMTAVGYGSDDPEQEKKFEHYWPADLHLVGKEIIRFHCVYWPAFLLAAELPLPRAITAHGWLLFEESKMSKSRGNIVRTETILEGFGERVYAKQFPESTRQERDLFATDVLRYFLLREISFGQDGGFSFDAMITRYNADLVNGFGNLVSRTLKLIEQNRNSTIPDPVCDLLRPFAKDEEERNLTPPWHPGLYAKASTGTTIRGFARTLNERNFAGALVGMSTAIAIVDGYINETKPWKLAKLTGEAEQQQLSDVLYTAAESIRIITALLYPILPHATAKVWAQLGLGSIEDAAARGDLKDLQWGGLKPGTKLGSLAPIFPRADKGLAQIMADTEQNNAPPAAAPAPDLTGVTAQRDAATGSESSLPEAPLSSATPPPGRLASEVAGSIAEVPADPTDPAAPPRTSALTTANPGATVGGSSAPGPELHRPPSHTEAPASGPFASAASAQPVSSGPAEGSPQITIDDFARIELRVAEIKVAERIPKADKLLRLEVDLGYERRQILSGIAEWYTPEDLVGRRIVVITNLAPRKMRGLESHGMLLAASHGEGGKPVLASFGEEIALGSRLK